MLEKRRNFLKKSLATGVWFLTLAGGLLKPILARAGWSASQYARTDFDSAIATLLGNQTAQTSNKISIKMPDVAENGAIVPITIISDLAQTESIAIVGEKNPVPLIAQFNFAPEMVKQLNARIKLGDTGNVIAIVRANGQFYRAQRFVKVTIGGCGD